jgi:hypothetical protein
MSNSIEIVSHSPIRIDQLQEELDLWLPDGVPVFIQSVPGVGKTELVHSYAKKIEAEVVVWVASMMDRLDLAGLPFVDKEKEVKITEFAPFSDVVHLSKEVCPKGPSVILYLNEFNAAPESVKPVFYRLLAERQIGHLNLRDNVYIIADGNPPYRGSAGKELQWAEKRRFAMYHLVPDMKAWLKWAYNNGIHPMILSFLEYGGFGKHFENFDPQRRDRLNWANPSSWEKLSRVLDQVLERKGNVLNTVESVIGHEAGADFFAYINHYKDLPDINKILKSPATADLPNKMDILSLVCVSVEEKVRESKKNLKPAVQLASRLLDSDDKSEYGMFLYRLLCRNSEYRQEVIIMDEFKESVNKLSTSKEFNEMLKVL